MYSKLLLLVLVVGLFYSVYGQSSSSSDSSSSSSSSSSGSSSSSDSSDSSDSGSGSIEENVSGSIEDPDNSTNVGEAGVFYPCGEERELGCIRDYFINSRQCRPVGSEGSPSVFRRRYAIYVPYVSSAVFTYNGEIKYGDEIYAEAFYVNTTTRNLVLALNFKSINLYAKNADYVICRRAKESLVVRDYVNATYSVVLTAVIPIFPRLNMRAAKVSAYLLETEPVYDLGPNFSESSDEVVAQAYQDMMDNKPTVTKEIFLHGAPSYFFAYFEQNVCSFGIPYSI